MSTETQAVRTVRITWVEAGTMNWNPAGPDDETIQSADELAEIREQAECHAEERGYDLSRYECRVEEV